MNPHADIAGLPRLDLGAVTSSFVSAATCARGLQTVSIVTAST
jgi:hypothetical protein